MNTTRDYVAGVIRRGVRGAQVAVDLTAEGYYAVRVVTAEFSGLSAADRQARVYEAMDALPPDVLATVAEIDCKTPWEE